MTYVLKRTDQGGGYVANPGRHNSYTTHIDHVRKFRTEADAEHERCKGNEIVVDLDQATGLQGGQHGL